MIELKKIQKQYGRQVVLSDLSCRFNDTGFYLLYGESGSGKTTLINLLAGLTPFDSGSITVNDCTFESRVDLLSAGLDWDYITQDAFFADFLSVHENLCLVSEDRDRIAMMLSRFGLSDVAEQSPATLSGGERQRLSIVRALLSQKKILFLDEPTASLDEANKIAVFELLQSIKKDTLVICSSHDHLAQNYADEMILFQKSTEEKEPVPNQVGHTAPSTHARSFPRTIETAQHKPSAGKYLRKWFRSKKRSRGAELKFCIFLTLSIMLILLGDLPTHKLRMNYENSYRIHALTLDILSQDAVDYDTLCEMENVRKVVLSYAGSTPEEANYEEDLTGDTIDERPSSQHELSLYTLPSEAEYFSLADKIAYGTYFTAEDQVILSYEAAERIYKGHHEKLIGSTITKNIYSRGDVSFEIVGVLGELNEFEKKYFLSLDMNWDDMYFNSQLTEPFIEDPNYYMADGQRTYYLYFDSYRDAVDFYDTYNEAFTEDLLFLDLGGRAKYGSEADMIYVLSMILTPLSVFIALFTVLFYASLIKTEITYNNRFISVFEYAGYEKSRVLSRFVGLHLSRLALLFGVSFAIALLLSESVNLLNRQMVFISFQLFTLNIPLILLYFLFVLLLSVISLSVSLHRVRVTNWYENLIRERDLL